MAPAHSLVAAWPFPAKDDTHISLGATFMAQEKQRAVQLTGAVPVPSQR